MAGFETIVRPVVFPNIRPTPAQILPPEDNPTQDIVSIAGGSGKFMEYSLTWDINITRQVPKAETKRQYDVQKVYQKDEQGKVNKKNFYVIEATTGLRLEGSQDGPEIVTYRNPPLADNVEVIQTDMVR